MAARDEFRGGIVAELETPEQLLGAVYRLRAEGYRALDSFAPFDVPGLDEALDLPASRIPWFVFLVALAGGAFAYWVQWYTSVVSYPLNAGGRPPNAVPSFIMITFESIVLAGAFAAVIAFLWTTRLPRLWHPLFEVRDFRSASSSSFWVGVDARDPNFHPSRTTASLNALSPRRVVWVSPGGSWRGSAPAAGPAPRHHAAEGEGAT